MIVAIGADHGGFEMKQELIECFQTKGIEFIDVGIYTKASADYPDIAEKVADAVLKKEADQGILICGTGIGISIAANKIPGIRCAHCHDAYSARMTRLHNDANILAMGGRVIGPELAKDIVEAYLSTPFSKEQRHQQRIDKISQIEKKYLKEGL